MPDFTITGFLVNHAGLAILLDFCSGYYAQLLTNGKMEIWNQKGQEEE